MATPIERTQPSLLLAAGDPANQEARARFAEAYGRLIREGCRGKGLQEADQDDVAQVVLAKLFQMLPTFHYDPTRKFRGLLHQMVRRAIVDLYRARQRRPGDRGSGDPQVLDRLSEVADDPAIEDLAQEVATEVAGQMERDRRLAAACEQVRGRIEPHTWQAFWLTTVEGEPTATVAERLGMTRDAVAVAKHRVTKMLRSAAAGPADPEGRGTRPAGNPRDVPE